MAPEQATVRAPRSMAEDLRTRDEAAIARLLGARPDLGADDSAEPARNAGAPGSVALALRRLNQLELQTLLAACVDIDPTTEQRILEVVLGADGSPLLEDVRTAVQTLHDRALLWGSMGELHAVGTAREQLVPADRGPEMAALDSKVAALCADPTRTREMYESAPTGSRAALDRLLSGQVIGSVVAARRTPDPDLGGMDWLLHEHLVVAVGKDRVAVPAEVVAILRGADATARHPLALVPPAPAAKVSASISAASNEAASGHWLTIMHGVTEAVVAWKRQPPSRIRSGGIAARDLTRTARAIGIAEPTTALLLEIATAAGLLAPEGDGSESVFLPTPAFDEWQATPPPQRLANLLRAWREMPRTTDPDTPPLGTPSDSPNAAALRAELIGILIANATPWTDAEIVSAVHWSSPRSFDAAREREIGVVLEHLRTLGLLAEGVSHGALTALLSPDATGLTEILAGGFPSEVNQVFLQADLTAIVPGIPTPELAALLRAAAVPESSGAASVFRFTSASVDAALAAGYSASDLQEGLASRGPVPQPLAYLIADVARRRAELPVGGNA